MSANNTYDSTTHPAFKAVPPAMGNPYTGAALGCVEAPPQDPPMRYYRPYALSQPYDMRRRCRDAGRPDGKPLFGMGLFLGDSVSLGRMIAQSGFDYVALDWEHTPFGIREITETIHQLNYASEGNSAVMVRIPSNEHHWVAWALDAGASGIIAPHIDNAQQAEKLVRSARFPNLGGFRSNPPCAVSYGINDGVPPGESLWDQWNKSAICAQIESLEGVKNAEEIAAVPGLDMLMIGHGDLRLELGLMPTNDGPEEEYNRCIQKILKAAQKHNLPVVTVTGGRESVAKRLDQGFKIMLTCNEGFMLAAGMREVLAESHTVKQDWEGGGTRVWGDEEWDVAVEMGKNQK